MKILIGHPTGNPNSHHAALAHYESGRLEAFCVPWFPTPGELHRLRSIPGLRKLVPRLEGRYFPPLADAPRVEGRLGEWGRMARRILFQKGGGAEQMAYEANDWLMETMRRELRRPSVTAVHSFEDCSLWQFESARRMGKLCIYDMPIGYFPAWAEAQATLARRYADWLPAGGLPSNRWARPEQKCREMELADLVLVPSTFVEKTIRQFVDKKIALAPYGVDLDFWQPRPPASRSQLPASAEGPPPRSAPPLRFIYAGQISIRKGIPFLLEAWSKAGLMDAELELVGSWQLAAEKQTRLPSGVTHCAHCSRSELRERYREADVFVFPSFFEGFGLVLLEAMACGLPALATDATAGPDLLDAGTGRVVAAGNLDQLISTLQWFGENRPLLPTMSRAARRKAEECTWKNYRLAVSSALQSFDRP